MILETHGSTLPAPRPEKSTLSPERKRVATGMPPVKLSNQSAHAAVSGPASLLVPVHVTVTGSSEITVSRGFQVSVPCRVNVSLPSLARTRVSGWPDSNKDAKA